MLKRKRLGPWASSDEASTGMMGGTSCAVAGRAVKASNRAARKALILFIASKPTPVRHDAP